MTFTNISRVQCRIGDSLRKDEIPLEGELFWDPLKNALGLWNPSDQTFNWFRIPRKGDNEYYTPNHEWEGATLRFQNGSGEWGPWTNLGVDIQQITTSPNEDGSFKLNFMLTNGNNLSVDTPVMRGLSNYELAVLNGVFTGTEEDYVTWSRGPSAYDVALATGFVGDKPAWLASLKGDSGFKVAQDNGFVGTEKEWLASLNGKNAYQVAVLYNGFVGTEIEWLASLNGRTAYQVAVAQGYVGTPDQWLESLNGDSGYKVAVDNGYSGTQTEWLASLVGKSAYQVALDNGYVGNVTQWLASLVGPVGPSGWVVMEANSTTNMTVKTGSVSFTIEKNKRFPVGTSVILRSKTNSLTRWMYGTITTYTASSGATVVNVIRTGSDVNLTSNSWLLHHVGLEGLQGPQGWSPVFATEAYNGKSLLKVVEWVGGDVRFEKPNIYGYISEDGIVANKDVAADLGGIDAYRLAVSKGFQGTMEAWLASLVGPVGPNGSVNMEAKSTSTATVGLGPKTFAIPAGKYFAIGVPVWVRYEDNEINVWMYGTVVSYTGTSLIVNVTRFEGAGILNKWAITLTGLEGPAGLDGKNAEEFELRSSDTHIQWRKTSRVRSHTGLVLDPSDLSTMFKDSSALTPVTEAGQTVGCMLDKSYGLEATPITEKEDIGLFAAAGTTPPEAVATDSFLGLPCRSVKFKAGMAVGYAGSRAATEVLFDRSVPRMVGARFEIALSRPLTGTEEIRAYFPNGGYMTNVPLTSATPSGWIPADEKYGYLTVSGSPVSFSVYLSKAVTSDVTVYVRQIEVLEKKGHHFIQPTTAKMPTLVRKPVTGVRNLLTYSEDLTNASWVGVSLVKTSNKIVANSTNSQHRLDKTMDVPAGALWSAKVKSAGLRYLNLRFDYSSTVFDLVDGVVVSDLNAGSGITDLGGGYYRVWAINGNESRPVLRLNISASTSAASSFVGDGVSGVEIVWQQLEMAQVATPYQKVVSAFDVTEDGVDDVWTLKFDGVDDSLYCPNFTLGATATILTGVEFGATAADAIILGNRKAALQGGFSIAKNAANAISVLENSNPNTVIQALVPTLGRSVVEVALDKGYLGVARNSEQVGSSNNNSIGALAGDSTFAIGGGVSSDPINPFAGEIAGVVVINKKLEGRGLAQTKSWMNKRTGITQ